MDIKATLFKEKKSASKTLLYGVAILLCLIYPAVAMMGRMNILNLYIVAIQNFWDGQNIYLLDPSTTDFFLYSPFFCVLLTPFYLMPKQVGMYFWAFTTIALCYVSIVIMVSWLGDKFSSKQKMWIGIATFIASFEYLAINVRSGQVNVILLSLVVIGLHLNYKKISNVGASFFLALAGMVKVFPFFFIFYYLLKREWKMCGYLALWGAVMFLIPAILIGFSENLTLLSEWAMSLDRNSVNPQMKLSLWALLNLYFLETDIAYQNGPDLVHLYWATQGSLKKIWAALLALYGGWIIYSVYRNGKLDDDQNGLRLLSELALVVMGFLLFSHMTESHTRPLIVPAFLLIISFYRTPWIIWSGVFIWIAQSLGKDVLGNDLYIQLYGHGSMNWGLVLFAVLTIILSKRVRTLRE